MFSMRSEKFAFYFKYTSYVTPHNLTFLKVVSGTLKSIRTDKLS